MDNFKKKFAMGLIVRKPGKEFLIHKVELNTPMEGKVAFKEPVDLHMNSRFKGTLEFNGTLTVSEHAEVEGNILGDNVIVSGKVSGDIAAYKLLVFMPTAAVHGNITTPKLNIVEGAVFQGNCHMTEELLDIDQVSRYLEIDIKEIESLAHSGKIPGRKEADGWKFERSQIDHWASSGRIA